MHCWGTLLDADSVKYTGLKIHKRTCETKMRTCNDCQQLVCCSLTNIERVMKRGKENQGSTSFFCKDVMTRLDLDAFYYCPREILEFLVS